MSPSEREERMEAVSRTRAALGRAGFDAVEASTLGSSAVAIDFEAPAQAPGMGRRHVGSSLIISGAGEVDTFVLRLPWADADRYGVLTVNHAVIEAIDETGMRDYAEPFMEAGHRINAHIQSTEGKTIPVDGPTLARKFSTAADVWREAVLRES